MIVDGPSTGHALGMLGAPRTMGEVAPVGPIGRQSRRLRDFLADGESSACVGVALAEELPVREVLELEQRLPGAAGRELDLIVVNGMYPDRFSDAEAAWIEALARRAGAEGALGAALYEHRRARAQVEQLSWLCERAHAPVLTDARADDRDRSGPQRCRPRHPPSEGGWLSSPHGWRSGGRADGARAAWRDDLLIGKRPKE